MSSLRGKKVSGTGHGACHAEISYALLRASIHTPRFRSGANAVQHVESGYCSGCLGQDNARRQIYDFARSKRGMGKYMDETPLLTYDGSNGGVPDFPYRCRECSKSFRQLSQLMQHQDQKHNNRRMLGY